MKNLFYTKNMKIEFNQDKLNILLQDFHNCTNIPISFYDLTFNCLFAYPKEMPTYCANIRNIPHFERSCNNCDNQHFQLVSDTKSFHMYTCHAGICEVVAPIVYEDVTIAFIMLGRFRDKENTYSSLEKIRDFAQKHNMDVEEQTRAYENMPVFSQSVISSSFNILKSLIQYIWAENLISTHKDLLPQKIENYIEQNLTQELTVQIICEQFFISKRTLYNIFHNEFQDTFKNYVLKKRLHLAKKMLLTTKLAVAEIAEQCGFNDYNYFTRIFTKKYGITPTRCRKNNTVPTTYI